MVTSLAVVGGVGGLLSLVGWYLATVFRCAGTGRQLHPLERPEEADPSEGSSQTDVVRADQSPDPLSVAEAT
jgi:hypothetical protein